LGKEEAPRAKSLLASQLSIARKKRRGAVQFGSAHGLVNMLDSPRLRRVHDSQSRFAKGCGAPTFSQCFWILIAIGITIWFIVKPSSVKEETLLFGGGSATNSSMRPLPAFSPQPSLVSEELYRAHLLAYYSELLAQGQVTRPTRRFASSELTHRVPTRRSGDKRRKERISVMDRAKPMTDDEEACIVGIMADEELFLDEWLAYHVMLGFGHFFICDNGRKQTLGQFLRPHVDAGYVTVVNWPDNHTFITTEKSNQLICYDMALFLMQEGEPGHKQCLFLLLISGKDDILPKCSWVSFLDCDEFLSLQGNWAGRNIRNYLASLHSDVGSQRIKEYRFGHNGHFYDPPPSSLLVTSFTTRENRMEFAKTKSLSRVHGIGPMTTPHQANARDGFVGQWALEDQLIMYHFRLRSFLRYMHRSTRGDVIKHQALSAEFPFVLLWRFVTSVSSLSKVEDLTLAKFEDKITQHLQWLNLWGDQRAARLAPYALHGTIELVIGNPQKNASIMERALLVPKKKAF